MYAVIREINFSYGHRLLDHKGKCRHLHGHNGRAEIEISAERLNERGMVVDFDEIKGKIQAWIEAELDHRTLLARRDPIAKVLKDSGEPVIVLDSDPTAENIARMIFEKAAAEGFPVSRVRFWETPASCVTYTGQREAGD